MSTTTTIRRPQPAKQSKATTDNPRIQEVRDMLTDRRFAGWADELRAELAQLESGQQTAAA